MRRPCAAEGEQPEIARIEALLDRGLADDVGHLELDDLRDAAGALEQSKAQPIANVFYRAFGTALVELDAAPSEIVRIDVAEHDVGVGHCRYLASLAVANRARDRACAFRSDPHGARRLIEPHHATAAGADRLEVDAGDEIFVLNDVARHGGGGRRPTPRT